jgi:two-component SAPR family response regulator
MTKNGPLTPVDNDAEDQELIVLSLQELESNHEVKLFQNAESALAYRYETTERPFMIVSDVNMPKMNGITFKRTIDGCDILRSKCVPFVFLSTSTRFVKEACDLNIQGYFEKGNSLKELRETMKIIPKYWNRTKHIN